MCLNQYSYCPKPLKKLYLFLHLTGLYFDTGWRLDYFLVSESIADKAYDSYILPDVGGSDHCPIGLILKL